MSVTNSALPIFSSRRKSAIPGFSLPASNVILFFTGHTISCALFCVVLPPISVAHIVTVCIPYFLKSGSFAYDTVTCVASDNLETNRSASMLSP